MNAFKVFILLSIVAFVVSLQDATEYVATVKINGQEDIVTLTKRGFSLEHARVGNPTVEAYTTDDGLKLLEELNFEFDAKPNEIQKTIREKRGVNEEYHNYDKLTNFLDETVARYSNISTKFSIGKSNQGRELWGIRISNNPGVNEVEPEFKYIANMHGDEVVGREMSIKLISLICSNYGVDDRITKLVDSVDIWIIPSMNPDGFERGTRGNANYKDLNRDFPDQFTSNHNDKIGRQPEVGAIMDWVSSHHFVLSANFHGGSVVANYPFDGNRNFRSGQYTSCPDDAVFKKLASTYADTHTTMRTAWEFASNNGITNGADWYVLYGGMQDWNYIWNGVFEITLEISEDKYPPASSLASFWDQNREAMLTYMELVNSMGVRGVVTNENGNPLDASINVVEINKPVRTDKEHGDYYRLLAQGTYTLTVSADGYATQTATVIIPDKQTKQIEQNFVLKKQ